jgi:hypothetical protein
MADQGGAMTYNVIECVRDLTPQLVMSFLLNYAIEIPKINSDVSLTHIYSEGGRDTYH